MIYALIIWAAVATTGWLYEVSRRMDREVDTYVRIARRQAREEQEDEAIALTRPPIGDATAAHIAAQEAASIDGEWAEMGGGVA